MAALGKIDNDMKSALIVSGVFHCAIFLLIIFGLPFMPKKPPVVETAPIAIQFVSAKKAADERATKKKKAPPPKKAAKPKPKPKKAPSMKAKKAPMLAQLKPKPPEPVKEEAPAEKQAEAVPLPPKVKAKPAPKKPKPPKPKKELTKKVPDANTQQFSSLLKNLMDEEDAQPDPALLERDLIQEKRVEQRIKEQDEALKNILNNFSNQQALPPTQQSRLGSSLDGRLNLTELDRIKQQLAECWHVLSGVRYAENLTVDVKLIMNPDRTVRNAMIMDQARYNRDNLFRAAADSALRALKMPACKVLDLPQEKYNQWQTTVITFDPREML